MWQTPSRRRAFGCLLRAAAGAARVRPVVRGRERVSSAARPTSSAPVQTPPKVIEPSVPDHAIDASPGPRRPAELWLRSKIVLFRA